MLRWLVACTTLAVPTLLAPSGAAADEAADLLAKHRAYVGWSMGDGSMPSIVANGVMTRREKAGETDIAQVRTTQAGLAYRTVTAYTKGGGVTYRGFTGSRFWYSTDNGFTVPVVTDERFNVLARAILFGEATAQLPTVVRKGDTIGGTPVVVLRQTPPKGTPIDLYVDPATGAFKRFVIDPEGDADPVDIDSYAEVMPGKRVISGYHAHGSSVYVRYSEIHPGTATASADLQPPPPFARWTFAKNAPVPIKVTDSRIYLDATVDGVAGRFILDTGSYGIVLTDAFADRIHFKRSQSITFGGIAGNKRGSAGTVGAITFKDGSKLQDVIVSSGVDLKNEADGLIGFDFFAGAIVDLDLDSSQLTLYDPAVAAPNEKGGIVVVADLSNGTPVIPVKINGSLVSHALLDSGDPGDALIAHGFRNKLRMLVDNTQLSSIAFVGGVSGNYEVDECGTLDSIGLGPITYQGTRACYSQSLGRDQSIVGIHFLRNFNITFDYPDAKLVLATRKR
jgi:predicted aspartyl protease